jgi:hypothetical protein
LKFNGVDKEVFEMLLNVKGMAIEFVDGCLSCYTCVTQTNERCWRKMRQESFVEQGFLKYLQDGDNFSKRCG